MWPRCLFRRGQWPPSSLTATKWKGRCCRGGRSHRWRRSRRCPLSGRFRARQRSTTQPMKGRRCPVHQSNVGAIGAPQCNQSIIPRPRAAALGGGRAATVTLSKMAVAAVLASGDQMGGGCGRQPIKCAAIGAPQCTQQLTPRPPLTLARPPPINNDGRASRKCESSGSGRGQLFRVRRGVARRHKGCCGRRRGGRGRRRCQ